MKERAENSQLVVLEPAMDHYTPLEATEKFNKAVKSFMDKSSRRRPRLDNIFLLFLTVIARQSTNSVRIRTIKKI